MQQWFPCLPRSPGGIWVEPTLLGREELMIVDAHPCSLCRLSQGTATWLSQLSFDSSSSSQHPLHHYFALQTSVESAHSSPPLASSNRVQATSTSSGPLPLPCVLPQPSICVSPSGCGNQMPEAECFVNNRNSFLTALRLGSPKSELADSAPGEGVFPGSWKTIFCVPAWY